MASRIMFTFAPRQTFSSPASNRLFLGFRSLHSSGSLRPGFHRTYGRSTPILNRHKQIPVYLQPKSLRGMSTVSGGGGEGEALPGELFFKEGSGVEAMDDMAAAEGSGLMEKGADIVAAVDTVTLPAGADMNLYTLVTSPANFVMATCDTIHNVTGLPWYVSIAAYAIALRTLFFPMLVGQKRSARRMRNAKPELSVLQDRIQQLKDDPRATPEQISETGQKMRAVYAKYQVNPLAMFAPALVQIVTGLASFYGVKRLCADPVLATGGDLWFLDLTVPDPTYMLAIGTATSMMISIYVGGDTDLPNEDAATANRMKAFGLGFGVLIVPFSMFLPSGVIVYIGATSVTMMLQTLFLKIPPVENHMIINKSLPPAGETVSPITLATKSSEFTSNRSRRRRERRSADKPTQ